MSSFSKWFVCIAVIGLVSPYSLLGDEIDDFVQTERQRQKVPGIAVLVVEDGKPTKMRGYGLANVEHKVPVKGETIFQSGSIGKQFTAAGILLLAEDGKLDIDDPLKKHFAEAPESWGNITVRHLLNHTSGLKDYGHEVDFRKDYTEDELLEVMMKQPFDFEPGDRWSYSNSGYVVLGILISKLTGEHWGAYLQERVLKPAGMETARVISESDIVLNRAAGYTRFNGKLQNQEWVAPTWLSTGDGALYFSVKDLFAWDKALRTRKIFNAETYIAWWTPVRLNDGSTYPYGLGWSLQEQRGQPIIGHGGAWQGFRTSIARYEKQDLTIAVLANSANAQPDAIVKGIAGLVNKQLELPDPATPGVDPDTDRTLQIKALLEAWSASQSHALMTSKLAKVDAENHRESFGRNRLADTLKNTKDFYWLTNDVVDGAGIQRRGEVIQRISYFGLETEKETLGFRVYFNAEEQVADFIRY